MPRKSYVELIPYSIKVTHVEKEKYIYTTQNRGDNLLSVAADNGFQDWNTEYEIAALDINYLVHYRGSSLNATANNALIRSKGYSQRWMAETSYSTIKRSLGKRGVARFWTHFSKQTSQLTGFVKY